MLYKYRSLKDFKRFVDIILNNRLYAAQYNKLNDPVEGHFLFDKVQNDKRYLKEIYNEKMKIGIVSLTEDATNTLMWSHYANTNTGIAI